MPSDTDPAEALKALHDKGFRGLGIGDAHGLAEVRYRHGWAGGADVVLVRAEDDAEAYRADDSLGQVEPQREVSGTVVEVVAAVLGWPDPGTDPGTTEPEAEPVVPAPRAATPARTPT
ncbi:hypothetical protein AB0A74_22345 [Saccharothrix sp. NPDC042600]|uniref:hypothetical protein n=1 Tax=Saccharothrix TaxID=2071 RepID=UPI0033CAD129|nr:hypothetical protein GCM10017745_53670 [Saccharothrix mutabilis subsp. capreolus]